MTAAVATRVEEVGAGSPGTTVRILAPYQTVYGSVVHIHGDTVEVTDSVAQYWVTSGWAVIADAAKP